MKEEIQRIKKLMGLSLISEQVKPAMVSPGGVVKGAKDFLEWLVSSGKFSTAELERMSKSKFGTVANLSEDQAKLILKNLNLKKIGKFLADTLVTASNKKIMFLNSIDQIKNGKTTITDVRKKFLESQYLSKLWNLATGGQSSAEVNNLILKLEKEFNKSLIKEFNSVASKIIEPSALQVFKNLEPTAMKAFREIFLTNWWRKKEVLEKQIEMILKRIDFKVNKKTPSGQPNPEKINADVKELFNVLASWKKSAGDDIKKLVEKHITNNMTIPWAVRKNVTEKGYIKEFLAKADEDIADTFWDVLGEKGAAYAKLLKFWDFLPFIKRWMNVVTWKTPQTYNEVFSQALRNGKTATLVEKALSQIFIHNIAIPAAIASAKTFRENQERIDMKENLDAILKMCKTGVIQDCPSEEEIKNINHMTNADFLRMWRESIPVVKLFIGENGEHRWTDALFFTWWDEIINALLDIWNDEAVGWGEKSKEMEKKLKDLRSGSEKLLREKFKIDPNNQSELDALIKKFEDEKKKVVEKVITFKDDQIKNFLKDWMNANGWEKLGDNDFEYMKNMGENKWSYESDEKNNDGTYKIYYFLFDPTKMTFKEL
jgi:hypothetical protein